MRKIIVWDLDGTLYPWNDIFWEEDLYAVARTIEKLGIMDINTAYKNALKSYRKYGLPFELFIKNYGVSFDVLDELHSDNYDFNVLNTPVELISFFKTKNPIIHNYIFSASPKNWVYKVLDQLGLKNYFDDEHIFTKEHLTNTKNTEIKILKHIIQCNKVVPKSVLVVDNNKDNLIIPKKLGCDTFLVSEHHYKDSIKQLVAKL